MRAVVSVLSNDATVSTLTGGQVFAGIEPPGKKVPYVVVSTEDIDPNPSKSEVSTLDYYQVEVFSVSRKLYTDSDGTVGAYDLSEACRAALDQQVQGLVSGQDIDRIDFESQNEYHDIEANNVKHTVYQEYRVILKR